MTRSPRTSGASRALLRTATATAALSSLTLLACASAPTAGADDTVRTVHPSGLGPAGPWFRLQETTPGRDPGIQEVSPKPDPVHLNGSLHLAIRHGEQAQAAHYFNATWTPEPMQPLLDSGISYWAYTSTEGSSVTNIGANLQLPASCGGFTTLSFEPGSNTDVQGDALKPDTWQKYRFTGDSVMRTSRAVAGVPAGGNAPLSHFVAECEGAYGVIANIGRLGDPKGRLNTFVDNITAKGTTWDFAVTANDGGPSPSPSPTRPHHPKPTQSGGHGGGHGNGNGHWGNGNGGGHGGGHGGGGGHSHGPSTSPSPSPSTSTGEGHGHGHGPSPSSSTGGGHGHGHGTGGGHSHGPSTSPSPSPSTGGGHGHGHGPSTSPSPSPSTGGGHGHGDGPSTGGGHGDDNGPSTGGGHGDGNGPSTGGGGGHGPLPDGPVDAGDGSTAATGMTANESAGLAGLGLAAGLLAAAGAALGGLRTVRRRRG
ncbi:hypothetical protein ABZS83_24340 [Streptomyces sp. NPDC005426]|uniref:hypothetical protein n=1 Tax=Streptomyces sp. NPDC005426 TaxID=3155344 RepID=UPI0033B1ACC1